MRSVFYGWLGVSLVAFAIIGCGGEASTPSDPGSEVSSAYLLDAEPEGGESVLAVRKAAKDADDVVIVGRIGGSENPWVEGMAAFSIVDPKLKACSDIPGDMCQTPWDYCCESELSKAKALIKIVDENGAVVKTDARKLLGAKELATVVVRGKAERDDADNLTVLASGVFVRK